MPNSITQEYIIANDFVKIFVKNTLWKFRTNRSNDTVQEKGRAQKGYYFLKICRARPFETFIAHNFSHRHYHRKILLILGWQKANAGHEHAHTLGLHFAMGNYYFWEILGFAYLRSIVDAFFVGTGISQG